MDSKIIQRAKALLIESLGESLCELNALDWKSALSGNTKRLAEHLSAFANESGGGFLVFGVSSDGESIGFTASKAEKTISTLGSIAREGVEPSVKISHRLIDHQDKKLLLVHIPESDQKPVHIRGKSIEYSFIRSAGQTRRMNTQELGQSLLRSRVPKYEELAAQPIQSSHGPQKLLEFLELDALFQLLQKPRPPSQQGIIEELLALRLLIEDEDKLKISNLGVLVAAKNFRDFHDHERRGPRVIRYKGNSRVETDKEFTENRGYAVGFQSLLKSVMELLPSHEEFKDALRINTALYPEISIREFLANAIIHQDLHIKGRSPMVEIFANRVEISNPGGLLPSVAVDRIIDVAPESRNELFARQLRQLRICEERGSGVDRALWAIESMGLPAPEFIDEGSTFRVVLVAPKKYRDMSKEERIRAAYQHCCLKYQSRDFMDNSSLRQRLGVSKANYPMVSKVIADAKKAKKIKNAQTGKRSGPHIKYVPFWVK